MVKRSGGRAGNDNVLAMLAGMVGAALYDFGMNGMLTAPVGYIQAKSGKKVPITTADYVQLGTSTALATYGFTGAGSGSRIPAFAFGMAVTQVVTKFMFPSAGIPRYFIYDIDSQGRITKL